MKRILPLVMVIIAPGLAVLGHRASSAQDKQDKYTLKVPGGLAFSDFKGYEDWQAVGPSQTDAQNVIRLILANPVMIDAYKQGVPGNGKPFPDGSKIAKIEWRPKKLTIPLFPRAPQTRCLVTSLRSSSSRRTARDSLTRTDGDMACSTMTPHPVASRLPH